MFVGIVVEGAVQGAVLAAVGLGLSRFTRDVVGRALLAFVLVVAAVLYIVFAAVAGESVGWLTAEAAGVALYGTAAVLGVRGSYWWLVAGWALHPVWDIALHYVGPGAAFAPTSYTVACLGFDLVVAAAIALAYRFGLVGRTAPAAELVR
jgi:hypothetical protein